MYIFKLTKAECNIHTAQFSFNPRNEKVGVSISKGFNLLICLTILLFSIQFYLLSIILNKKIIPFYSNASLQVCMAFWHCVHTTKFPFL